MRSCRAEENVFFKKGKKHRDECNDQAIQPNIQAPYLALKTQLKLDAKHIDPHTHTHTHTHTTSLTNFIFQKQVKII